MVDFLRHRGGNSRRIAWAPERERRVNPSRQLGAAARNGNAWGKPAVCANARTLYSRSLAALTDNVIITFPCPRYADNLCRSLRARLAHTSCFNVRIYERAYTDRRGGDGYTTRCGASLREECSSSCTHNRHLTQIAGVLLSDDERPAELLPAGAILISRRDAARGPEDKSHYSDAPPVSRYPRRYPPARRGRRSRENDVQDCPEPERAANASAGRVMHEKVWLD